jgi:glucokinase
VPEPVCVGIDIGGTKLVAAALTEDGTPVRRERTETPADGSEQELVDALVGLVRRLGPGLPVGVGIAGLVDADGRIRYGPNVAVRDLPLQQRLADALGVRVVVRNDASVAVYGEWAAGAGRGHDDLIMLTLGTGVGGGVMLAGRLAEGAHGFGGELGHMIIHEGGRLCPCGNLGCLEAYASGTSIGRRAAELLSQEAAPSALLDAGREPSGKQVTEAALAGDPLARRVLTEAGTALGVGIASLANAFDPSRILIGGGAGIHGAELLRPAAVDAAQERLMGRAFRPALDIAVADLGDDAGMVGAGLLAVHGA